MYNFSGKLYKLIAPCGILFLGLPLTLKMHLEYSAWQTDFLSNALDDYTALSGSVIGVNTYEAKNYNIYRHNFIDLCY